jgi:hypothetical protein
MCKHLAAVLYGIGARLDHQPELLFVLRQVDATDLLAKAGTGLAVGAQGPAGDRTLAEDEVGALFGLEMAPMAPTPPRTAQTKAHAATTPAQRHRSTTTPRSTSRLSGGDPTSRLRRLLRKRGSLDNTEARSATGLDAASVRPLLRRLVAEGHARVEGLKRGTRYIAT